MTSSPSPAGSVDAVVTDLHMPTGKSGDERASGDNAVYDFNRRIITMAGNVALLAALRYPLMTVLVMARIHWQALGLALRRIPFHRKPSPPLEEITR